MYLFKFIFCEKFDYLYFGWIELLYNLGLLVY